MYWSMFMAGRIYEDFVVKGGFGMPVGASYSREVFATREDFNRIVGHLRLVLNGTDYDFQEMPLENELGFLLIIQRQPNVDVQEHNN